MIFTKKELGALLSFASGDTTRPNLMHPAIVRQWGGAWIVATDGHALVAKRMPDLPPDNDELLCQPLPALTAAYKLLSGKKGARAVLARDGNVLITETDVTVGHTPSKMVFPSLTFLGESAGDEAVATSFDGKLLKRVGLIQEAMDFNERHDIGPGGYVSLYPTLNPTAPFELTTTNGEWLIVCMPVRMEPRPSVLGA
jgi:hypothetical protein